MEAINTTALEKQLENTLGKEKEQRRYHFKSNYIPMTSIMSLTLHSQDKVVNMSLLLSLRNKLLQQN